jgi:hypothetical protein
MPIGLLDAFRARCGRRKQAAERDRRPDAVHLAPIAERIEPVAGLDTEDIGPACACRDTAKGFMNALRAKVKQFDADSASITHTTASSRRMLAWRTPAAG